MIPRLRLALCALALASFCCLERADARPFELKDTVSRERIGAVAASPKGDFLVFERQGAYNSAQDYALTSPMSSWGRSDLYLVDTKSKEKNLRRLLPETDPRRLSLGDFLISGSFSPDGKKITVFWPEGPQIHLGYYDLAANQLIDVSRSPAINIARFQPVWLSNSQLLYVSAANGEDNFSARRYVAAQTTQAEWAKAFAGNVTAKVFSSLDAANPSTDYQEELRVFDTLLQKQRKVMNGRFSSFARSPDGSQFAALHVSGPAAQPPGSRSEFEFDRGEVVVFDANAKIIERASCASCDALHDSIAWSSDSRRLAYFARPVGGTLSQGAYWIYDTRHNENSRVDTSGVALSRASYVVPAARAFPVADGLVFEGVGSCGANDVARHFYFVKSGSRPRCISPAGAAQGEVLAVSQNAVDIFLDGQVWRTFLDPEKVPVGLFATVIGAPLLSNEFGVQVNGLGAIPVGPLRRFAARSANANSAVLSMDIQKRTQEITRPPQTAAVLLGGSPTSGSFLYRVEKEGVSHIVLVRPHASPVEIMVLNKRYGEVELPIERQLRYAAPSGKMLISCITTPTGPPPVHGYPTVVVIYPEYSPTCSPNATTIDLDDVEAANLSSDTGFMKSMASKGMAILTVASPRDEYFSPHGMGGQDELIERALKAGAAMGLVDLTRVGLTGHSQGAGAGLWVLTHTLRRYAAAVLANGLSDNFSHFGAGGAGLVSLVLRQDGYGFGAESAYANPNSMWYLGGAPWEVPDAYLNNNEIVRSNRISAPLLLLNSDMDGLNITGFAELYSALSYQGKEVTLVTYLGEGHVPSSPANIEDAWKRQVDWFWMHFQRGIPGEQGPSATGYAEPKALQESH